MRPKRENRKMSKDKSLVALNIKEIHEKKTQQLDKVFQGWWVPYCLGINDYASKISNTF